MSESPDLRSEFLDEEYAHSYMEEFLNAQIATQIKVLREQRGWSQTELAGRAGMKQPRLSLLEDVSYGAWSITTLRRLARAFDLRLRVSFETFSSGISEIAAFGRASLQRSSRLEDLRAQQAAVTVPPSNVTDLLEWKRTNQFPEVALGTPQGTVRPGTGTAEAGQLETHAQRRRAELSRAQSRDNEYQAHAQ